MSRHVAIVSETYPPEINGVARTLGRLVLELRLAGSVVSVVHPRRADDVAGVPGGGTMLVPGLGVPGYPGVRIGLPAGPVLRARWMSHPPDAVYVATPGPLGWSALQTARHLGFPVWSGFHTNFHHYARHYHAGWLQHVVHRALRRFHNATDGTLVPTAELRDELAVAGFRGLHVLGRGVDAERFAPTRRSAELRTRWGAGPDDLVVAYIGRLAAEKNVRLAVTAYRAMRGTGRVGPFVVVGDGPIRASLARANPDLVFTGMQEGEALAAHYASADVFLFPSETETFGNVILEAMASGLAVVAYDYAAARAHLRDGGTASLAAPGDGRGFVDRAVTLARSPSTARMLGTRARAAALALDWPEVVRRFETLLFDHSKRAAADRAVVAAG